MKRQSPQFTAADFFAGIGGLRTGFEKVGFKIVYANDNNPYARKTYAANFGEVDSRDIREIDVDTIPDFDVLLAGFPCEPYSMIGKRRGLDDERGQLFFQIVKILNAKRPLAFLLENVKHLKLYDGGRVFARMQDSLRWSGYTLHSDILDSQNFGVPQHRERIYMLGFLGEDIPFTFPRGTGEKVILAAALEAKVDEFFYLSERYYRGLLKHKNRHRKKGNGFGCVILDPNGIANTVVAGNMGRERNLIRDIAVRKNRWGIRRLTIRECARLQGFGDNFVFPVSSTRAYEQLGNAVTVPVAKALAGEIKKVLLLRYTDRTGPSPRSSLGKFFSGELQKTAAA